MQAAAWLDPEKELQLKRQLQEQLLKYNLSLGEVEAETGLHLSLLQKWMQGLLNGYGIPEKVSAYLEGLS